MKSIKRKLLCGLFFFTSIISYAQEAMLGSWSGKISVGQTSLTLVFNLDKSEDGGLVCTMDSPDQGAGGIKAEAVVSSSIVLEISIAQLGASFKGVLFGNSISGTFSQSGRDFPLTLTKGVIKANRPQTPVGPFPYKEEEVSFTNEAAGAVLAGTLIIPENASSETPIIIMITGSGQEDRNEEVFEHKPFLVIADYLARNGIASLRYDDRGFGESRGGDLKNATSLDFRDDAKAGLDYLRSRGGFGSIGVLGHSEGASIAFMLGASGDADFVISLAGIGVKGEEALLAQANRILELQGSENRYTLDLYRQLVASQGNPWLSWFCAYDPVADIKACNCPVFAVNGDKDIQVISSLNLNSIKANLPENPANFIKEYPSLNHLFQTCKTGDTSEYRTIEETFSATLLGDLAKWLNSR